MSTLSIYGRIGRSGRHVIAGALLVLLASCDAPETQPPDATPSTAVDSMGSAQAPAPVTPSGAAPLAPAPPEAAPADVVPTPVRTISAQFCALCTDALQRGWIVERPESYRSQCSLCPSERLMPVAGPVTRIDRARGGYTVIVLSSSARTDAEAIAGRFRQDLGNPLLPVEVLESSVDGTPRYRVGVGQVATVEEAVALRDRLAAALPRDAWITRIK